MHRIIRTALASLGAAVVVAGGSLGVAYATTPAPAPAQTPTSADADQVAALNQAADDLLAKIGTLEKQLASMPAPTSSPSELTKQELVAPTTQAAAPTSATAQASRTTAQAPLPAASSSSAQGTDGHDSQNGNSTND
jgi:hypothetical protein